MLCAENQLFLEKKPDGKEWFDSMGIALHCVWNTIAELNFSLDKAISSGLHEN